MPLITIVQPHTFVVIPLEVDRRGDTFSPHWEGVPTFPHSGARCEHLFVRTKLDRFDQEQNYRHDQVATQQVHPG
jgi:hypothetical protein